MLTFAGLMTMAIVYITAAHERLSDVHEPPMMSLIISKPRSQLSGVPVSAQDYVPSIYPYDVDVVNRKLAFNEHQSDTNDFLRSLTEERMGKRSIALGRSGFRPGKRSGKSSLAMAFESSPHGKKTGSILGDSVYSDFEKRSMAMGRLNFRPGKRTNGIRDINDRQRN